MMAVWILAGVELLKHLVAHVFRKFVSPGFITKKDCDNCSDKKDGNTEEIKTDVKNIKQILIVMAPKVGVDEKDLRLLVS